jgi:hypothetical protein
MNSWSDCRDVTDSQWLEGCLEAEAAPRSSRTLRIRESLMFASPRGLTNYRANECRDRSVRSNSRDKARKEGRCYKCGRRGHKQRDCSHSRSRSRSRSRRGGRRSRSASSYSRSSSRGGRRHRKRSYTPKRGKSGDRRRGRSYSSRDSRSHSRGDSRSKSAEKSPTTANAEEKRANGVSGSPRKGSPEGADASKGNAQPPSESA